jgi:hypothetical protein
VIIGVFLAFQITEWNASRLERNTEQRYLQEIAADIRKDLIELGGARDAARHRISAVNYLLNHALDAKPPTHVSFGTATIPFPNVPSPSPDQLDNLLGQVHFIYTVQTNRSGFNALISVGNIRLLRNREVARSIQGYYAASDAFLDYQKTVRGFRDRLVEACQDSGLSLFGDVPAANLVAIIKNNKGLTARLETTRQLALQQIEFIKFVETNAQAALQGVDPPKPGPNPQN